MEDACFQVFGTVSTSDSKEAAQFQRVLSILRNHTNCLKSWTLAFVSVKYDHEAGDCIDNDSHWTGEADLILFKPNRIIVFELKSSRNRLLRGRSDTRPWLFERADGTTYERTSPFGQLSKTRAHLLQQRLNDAKSIVEGLEHAHFKVDCRLVVPNNVDYSSFYWTFPHDFTEQELHEEVLPYIRRKKDLEFVLDRFSVKRKRRIGELYCLAPDTRGSARRKLNAILPDHVIGKRHKAWFKILRESEIKEDLESGGYDEFRLTLEQALEVARMLMKE